MATFSVSVERFNGVSNGTKGVLLALISTALFVLVGVIVRTLSDSIGVFQILLFRQLVFVAVLVPAIRANIQTLLRPKKIKLHALRITGAFLALSLGYITVSNIPLADATALGFTQVVFVALISRLVLKESVGLDRQFTIWVGFIGVMLMVQPSFDNASMLFTTTGLVAALGAAMAVICVKQVSKTEPTITLLTYQAIFVGLMALIPSLFDWHWPTLSELALLILVGGISSVAQWFGVTAYKYGEANVVANVKYVEVLYAMGLGYWVFAEVPGLLSGVGAAVLIASALLPMVYSKRDLFARPA